LLLLPQKRRTNKSSSCCSFSSLPLLAQDVHEADPQGEIGSSPGSSVASGSAAAGSVSSAAPDVYNNGNAHPRMSERFGRVTQTAGPTFPSLSGLHHCFPEHSSARNRISSPFLPHAPHGVRISQRTELRPPPAPTTPRAHGDTNAWGAPVTIASSRPGWQSSPARRMRLPTELADT
jgi:hypothetical protein